MPRSKPKLTEVIVTQEARMLLSGEEICQALSKHLPQKGVSTFRSERGHEVLVVTEDQLTTVTLHSP